MSILSEIIANKKIEVERAKQKFSVEALSSSEFYSRTGISLKNKLQNTENKPQIITEFKRKSPSKGEINIGAGIVETAMAYATGGAAAISILTDTVYFGGFKEDLVQARKNISETALLRKDFMIDSYQLHEAKAWGADVILLIAANLEPAQVQELSAEAHALGLEVLLEVHDLDEIKSSDFSNIDVVGVNNRNLKNFAENNVNASLELFNFLPAHLPKISESCIHAAETVKLLDKAGYSGFLIGENFMKTADPGKAFKDFIAECNA